MKVGGEMLGIVVIRVNVDGNDKSGCFGAFFIRTSYFVLRNRT